MFGTVVRACCAALLAAAALPAHAREAPKETTRYVRPAGDRFVTECAIVRAGDGWTIVSRTDRGKARMEVEARYGAGDRLTSAHVTLVNAGKTAKAEIAVKDGKATVTRPGQPPQDFDAPPGTVVTSAPDWTDVFLLCRRYDRKAGGKQEFPALWAHPTQPARRLTFTVERQGTDSIEHGGKKVELGRYLIRIRDGSAYAAWADAEGKMVRLIPLPLKGAPAGLTLEGYEKGTAGLRPQP